MICLVFSDSANFSFDSANVGVFNLQSQYDPPFNLRRICESGKEAAATTRINRKP